MRISLSIAIFAWPLGHVSMMVEGFFLMPSSNDRLPLLRLADDATGDTGPARTMPTSPEDIKTRMGIPDEDEAPSKLFSDNLYEDMRQTLLTLEKRIKEGPGCLSILEVEEFSAQTQRIAVEMREFEDCQKSGLGSASKPSTVDAVAQAALESEMMESNEVIDTSNDDDGPKYDGTGGMGMAKGTRNTYILPGMDAMSPEEYRAALNQSILDRQKERQAVGGYGNRATWDYLNNLTGEKGVLKKDDEEVQP